MSATDQIEHENRDSDEHVEPELLGDLPCLGCRYNLRGLSVRSSCPECGLPVRATLLAVVDPYASELVPLSRPGITAAGLLLWSSGGLAAVVLHWAVLLSTSASSVGSPASFLSVIGCYALAFSALGALVFVRPHPETPRWESFAAAAGVLAYVPLILATWHLREHVDPRTGSVYFSGVGVVIERTLTRIVITLSAIGVLMGVRGAARSFVSRSMLMRTGRVDRQTVLATVAALSITLLGDLIHLLSAAPVPVLSGTGREVAELSGTILVLVGSALTTLAVGGIFLDSLRLRPVIASHPFGFGDVLAFRSAEGESV